MPELPEVEVARASVEPLVAGRRITSVDLHRPTVIRRVPSRQFAAGLVGKRVKRVRRRGKALLFDLAPSWVLVFRFMLWGLLRVRSGATPADPQTAVVLHFRGGMQLEFRELQLSSLTLYRTREFSRDAFFATMGIDPLAPAFDREYFAVLCKSRGTIRAVLTDQQRLAGIGNLWAHEVLHAARLRPSRSAASLSESERTGLFHAIGRVLRRGIRSGGEPAFIDALGRRGRYRLAVYGCGGKRCPRGDGIIRASRLGGRPSFYCPTCQR